MMGLNGRLCTTASDVTGWHIHEVKGGAGERGRDRWSHRNDRAAPPGCVGVVVASDGSPRKGTLATCKRKTGMGKVGWEVGEIVDEAERRSTGVTPHKKDNQTREETTRDNRRAL